MYTRDLLGDAQVPDVRKTLPGVLTLSVATLIWGTTFVVIRKLVALPAIPLPPSAVIAGRFILAAVLFLPFLRLDRNLWRGGIELGVLLWAGYATQAIGLQYIGAGRSAFMTALYVAFTPAMVVLSGRRVAPIVAVAAALALAGTALLSFDREPPNRGDAWTILSAVFWAAYILRLEGWANRLPINALTAVQLLVVAVLSVGWAGIEMALPGGQQAIRGINWPAVLNVLYLGVVATALTTWLQATGQRTVPAPQAALLYSMEPVWAAFFAWLAFGERFGRNGWLGAAAILTAAVTSQWASNRRTA
jgi:drug/metabolite transporter (DMT)-like permease